MFCKRFIYVDWKSKYNLLLFIKQNKKIDIFNAIIEILVCKKVGKMLSIYQLKKHLRNTHQISIKTSQTQALRNIGYYHGFKGYRFIHKSINVINFSSLDEVIALNKYDMQLKAILYPKVMFIETALKNYLIEALLNNSKSEKFDDIYEKSLTVYKKYKLGSKEYRNEYTQRLKLKGRINSVVVNNYNKNVVSHFLDSDVSIPIWAIFENLTLGEFGNFFKRSNPEVKQYVSRIMKLPVNLDSDGLATQFLIFTMRDLRNAIAHNNIVFDARFKTSKIDGRLNKLLENETGVSQIDFKYMDAYFIMITYFLRKMGETKTSCKQFIISYQQQTEYLRTIVPLNIYNQIIGTQHRNNMKALQTFITNSK